MQVDIFHGIDNRGTGSDGNRVGGVRILRHSATDAFGANRTLLPLAKAYLFPVKFAVPSFLLTQLMAAFLRNDGSPGLATVMGSVLSLLMMLTHLRSPRNTLRFRKPSKLFLKIRNICTTGLATLSFHPDFHDPDGERHGDSPFDYSPVRNQLPAVAAEHVLYLLLPGATKAPHFSLGIRGERRSH